MSSSGQIVGSRWLRTWLRRFSHVTSDVTGKLPGYLSTSMGSEFRDSVFKVLTSCGSGQLRAKMNADLVNGRLHRMVIICMLFQKRSH